MSAEELSAITGLPPEEASQFLEMAGGNLEAAVSLFFEMGGGGGDAMMGAPGGSPTFTPPTPAHGMLFGDDAAPASWLDQGFEFSEDPTSCIGVVQHKNGPCGVLAAVNGVIVAQANCPHASTVVTDDMLASALASILVRCATAPLGTKSDATPSTKVVVASWVDGGYTSNQVQEIELPVEKVAVASHLKGMITSLKGPGGVVQFCYSAVLSRGLDVVRSEALSDGGRPPLVVGPHSLCSTELMGLLMFGIARGNVSAYDGADGTKIQWRPKDEVGMLSRDEIDMGIPLADELKDPSKPVYVIHGGDHFTLLWATKVEGDSIDFLHWNGLPPNRGMVPIRLTNASLEPRPAPEKHVQSHWRITVGEVESIVQACPADKQAKPNCWRAHAYELALATQAVVDEDKSEERPASIPSPTTFEQGPLPADGAAWRCLTCYQTRFKTMCFGENTAPAARICKFCGMDVEKSGWTIWKQYSELPISLKRRIDRTSGPKILAVLRTRWPDSELSLFRSDGSVQVMGEEGFDPKEFVTPVA